mmetsp:Transcript_58721/g.132377  ORF Transcript_58721/g.132377 Transcript_58721/m.132377 type:complete len:133 (+) Transcript_58721:61-459(+)|eukprot:CAMPEP_0197913094 /NCGR_PEP_ID=MMETSP1439-20131203/76039_1 /TAXON_ID=66791 /ORGANISM="Gonyaulax spinifera, Strain CCMP409" /LENGTH=132 /DNA_ID=CAMNT_0043534925 /DNA_START=51 /DNA_END=449 /DNA_ORIENTATION=-
MREKVEEQKLKHEAELKALELQKIQHEEEAKKKQIQLLEPASLKEEVKQQALKEWSELSNGWEGETAAARAHDTVVTYSDLNDPEGIKKHVAKLFEGVPGGVKAELTKMASGVIVCVKSCNSITDALDARKV